MTSWWIVKAWSNIRITLTKFLLRHKTILSKLKRPKVIFFHRKIKYVRHIIDKDGRRPDPELAAAIRDLPVSDNIASLQSFLGLTNYYQVFIQNMHELRVPRLNKLLNKGKPWGICWPPHLTGKCDTRPFFRLDRAQGHSPQVPGVPKNALGPVGIPLVRGASGAGQLTQPPSKGGKSLVGKPPEAEGKYSNHQASPGRIRAPIARPTEMMGWWPGKRQALGLDCGMPRDI